MLNKINGCSYLRADVNEFLRKKSASNDDCIKCVFISRGSGFTTVIYRCIISHKRIFYNTEIIPFMEGRKKRIIIWHKM